MSETTVPVTPVSPAPKTNLLTLKRVAVVAGVALVAAASAVIARSELFASAEEQELENAVNGTTAPTEQ